MEKTVASCLPRYKRGKGFRRREIGELELVLVNLMLSLCLGCICGVRLLRGSIFQEATSYNCIKMYPFSPSEMLFQNFILTGLTGSGALLGRKFET